MATLALGSLPPSVAFAQEVDYEGDCTVEDQCPETGVACAFPVLLDEEGAACRREAQERGLELACHGQNGAEVYCDPDEGGCSVGRTGAGAPGHVALAAALIAAVATARRGRRACAGRSPTVSRRPR